MSTSIYNSSFQKTTVEKKTKELLYIIRQFDIHFRFYGTTDDMLKCVKNEAEVVHDPNIKRVSTTCII